MPTPTWSLKFNPNDFLHSLCKFIVAQAALFTPAVTLAYATEPRSIWRNKAVENVAGGPVQCANPYSVLQTYPGPPLLRASRYPRLRVQVQTQGVDNDTVSGDELSLAQAGAIFQAFLMPDDAAGNVGGDPIRDLTIPASKAADDSTDGNYFLVYCNPLQQPGLISRDGRGRGLFVFNVEIGFRKVT